MCHRCAGAGTVRCSLLHVRWMFMCQCHSLFGICAIQGCLMCWGPNSGESDGHGSGSDTESGYGSYESESDGANDHDDADEDGVDIASLAQ